MKKGILFYFIAASILLHLLAIFALKFLPQEYLDKIKEKEPIAIDIVGPLKHGPKTILPKAEKGQPGTGQEKKPAKSEVKPPRQPDRLARPAPPMPAPRAPRPALVSPPPAPAPRPSNPPVSRPPSGPDGLAPAPPEGGRRYAAPDAPQRYQPSQQAVPGGPSGASPSAREAPRRLIKPSEEDLQRYAKTDEQPMRAMPETGITLDTEDLKYTSYMQGLKKRIELIWKYPDTAQRDGLQGTLVIRFAISKSGRVTDVELVKSSGYNLLDDAAKQALHDASPFNPLPDSWKKDEFVITGTFVYRMYDMYVR